MEAVLSNKINFTNKINTNSVLKLKKIKVTDQRNFNRNNSINFVENKTDLNLERNIINLKDQLSEKRKNSENLNNEENSYDNLSETDFSSSKSQEQVINKLSAEEIYNNIDDINNNNSNEEEELENNKRIENKLTKDIKSIFIEPKNSRESTSDSHESSTLSLSNINRSSVASSTETVDYELVFCRNGEDLRKSYIAKLISTNVWNPNDKEKIHNSIFIFDWDDTLLPTSFLSPGGVFDIDFRLSKSDNEKLSLIEKEVTNILNNAINKGEVYIITNADKGWVEFSASKFYPSIMGLLSKIKIISARDEYEKKFPGETEKWKIEAFLNLQKHINPNLVTNLLCFGDSIFEIKAGKILASKFREAFIKTIKFKEAPKLDDILKQLTLVTKKFDYIYSSIKNMTIKVERKKN